ncbi:MAG: urate hydroxylase PuuD [Gammaproteobacteria bacterium]|nr:urate hydroxylase PuuD [Gammaproteobacteria bacterium]
MDAYLFDWLSLLGRWVHLITGIAWIGASFYFVWLDNHLLKPANPADAAKGVGGELWSVHGGGFYHAQKYALAPAQMPGSLHWFYWEAYSTWLSGFFLLCVLYYRSPEVYMIDPAVAALAGWQAVAIGLGSLLAGWAVYDGLCRSPLGRDDRALAAVLALLLCAAAWGLCQVFSGRGAFLHFGAMMATIMAANVLMVIIPGQRKNVAAMSRDEAPNPVYGARGKQRSVHNTYFTLPVLFTMISNHYAMTYGGAYNWLVLIGLCFAGAAIRAWFVARHKAHERGGKTSPLPAIVGVLAILVVVVALRPTPPAAAQVTAADDTASTETVEVPSFERAQAIVIERCAGCHAEQPTQPGFYSAPLGIELDTPETLLAHLEQVRQQVASRAMPIGNLTKMTDAERAQLIAWIDAGAPQP